MKVTAPILKQFVCHFLKAYILQLFMASWRFGESVGVKFFDIGIRVLYLSARGVKKRLKQQQTDIYILLQFIAVHLLNDIFTLYAGFACLPVSECL